MNQLIYQWKAETIRDRRLAEENLFSPLSDLGEDSYGIDTQEYPEEEEGDFPEEGSFDFGSDSEFDFENNPDLNLSKADLDILRKSKQPPPGKVHGTPPRGGSGPGCPQDDLTTDLSDAGFPEFDFLAESKPKNGMAQRYPKTPRELGTLNRKTVVYPMTRVSRKELKIICESNRTTRYYDHRNYEGVKLYRAPVCEILIVHRIVQKVLPYLRSDLDLVINHLYRASKKYRRPSLYKLISFLKTMSSPLKGEVHHLY